MKLVLIILLVLAFSAACFADTSEKDKKLENGKEVNMSTSKHPIEKLVKTITYKGVEFEIVERPDVIWVGCVDYASNNTDESDISGTLKRYREELIDIKKQELINPDWSAALSINYTCNDKPCGIMFAQETYSDKQDKRYDLFTQPGGLWLRVLNNNKNSSILLGKENAAPYEYFADARVLQNAAKENGYIQNPDVHVQVEYHCHAQYNTPPHANYAYIPIIKSEEKKDDVKPASETKDSVKIVRVYEEKFPNLRFIGKKAVGTDWGMWFEKGWFEEIEKLGAAPENGDAYIGLMSVNKKGESSYFIGMFFPENTKVPEGFEYIDFPKSNIGSYWVYGKSPNGYQGMCMEKLKENNMVMRDDFGKKKGTSYFFERYNCPRYTTPDIAGNIITDYCFFIK